MASIEEGNLMEDEALIWDLELKRIGDDFNDIFIDCWKFTDNELLDQVGDLLHPRSYPELEQLPPPVPQLLPSTSKSDWKPTSMALDCCTASSMRTVISRTKSATTTTTTTTTRVNSTKEVTQSLSYTDKVELSKRKLKEGYDQYKQSRKKLCLIGVSDIPSKPSRALPTTKRVVGGRKSSTQNKDCQKKRSPPCASRKECSVSSSTEQKKKLVKRKLQEEYDQRNESRKKTRLIGLKDIPSNPCGVLPKVKRLAGGSTAGHSIPVPRKVCGF